MKVACMEILYKKNIFCVYIEYNNLGGALVHKLMGSNSFFNW